MPNTKGGNDELGNVITAFPIKEDIINIYVRDENIEFSDELLNYIHKLSKGARLDMSILCKIDPYDDVEISNNDLSHIIEISDYILRKSFLENDEDQDEWKQMLKNLVEFAKKAITENSGLISIGD